LQKLSDLRQSCWKL